MMEIIRAEKRHFQDLGWLQTHRLFSFSDYQDPENVSHGALRVFNDDIVQPRSGFETHPHREMEIISIMLHGEMVHKDSMGNELVIRKNDVQRMTAGTGLSHSEWNNSDGQAAFFQIWIIPDKQGLSPSYDQQSFEPDLWNNRLALLASGRDNAHVVALNVDASLYRAVLDQGQIVGHVTDKERKVFLYIIEGEVSENSTLGGARDQIRLSNEARMHLQAQSATDFILIDIPDV